MIKPVPQTKSCTRLLQSVYNVFVFCLFVCLIVFKNQIAFELELFTFIFLQSGNVYMLTFSYVLSNFTLLFFVCWLLFTQQRCGFSAGGLKACSRFFFLCGSVSLTKVRDDKFILFRFCCGSLIHFFFITENTQTHFH